jgi:lysophospholipase L1-like esterase
MKTLPLCIFGLTFWQKRAAVLLVSIIWVGTTFSVQAQDPLRFTDEIQTLIAKQDSTWQAGQETVVFTGSSSIRLWDGLRDSFPGVQIINTGFGGSQASDLLFYLDTLVLKYKPSKVFIYEGDNDLAEGKRPGQVVRTKELIISGIHRAFPEAEVVLIAAKPSISRWRLRGKYRRYNRKLQRMARKQDLIEFADIWRPMLKDGRVLQKQLFIEDGLHMNASGYVIWLEVIRPYLIPNNEESIP